MSARKSPPSDFRKILERLSHRHDTRRVFDAFIRFAACAVAAQTREAEYLEEVKHWGKPELDLFAEALGALVLEMESRPFEDLIGGYYMEFALSQKGQQWHGEFHTPKTNQIYKRMTEAEIYANPQRIQGLAEELRTFGSNLRSELEKMNSGFRALGSTWRDQDYEKFKRSFEQLKEEVEKIAQEITRREPELKEDAQTLLAYINKTMS